MVKTLTELERPPTPLEPASFPPAAGLLYSAQAGQEGRLCYFDGRGIPQCPVVLTRGWISEAKWSPDKSRIAYVAALTDESYGLWVVRPHGSEQAQVGSQAPYITFEWRPDSVWLDYSLWNSYDPHEHDPLRDQRFVTNVETLDTHPIENQCEEAYSVYAAAGGTIPGDKFLGRCKYHNIRWSPDRSWLAISTHLVEDGKALMQLHLIYTPTNRLAQPDLPYPTIGIGNWAPDSHWLLVSASGDHAGGMFLLDSSTLELRRVPVGVSQWSPNGEWLSGTRFEGGECLYVMRSDEAEQRRLACGLLGSTHFWSPDSRRIAYEPAGQDSEDGADILIILVDDGSSQKFSMDGLATIQDWR